VRGGERGEEVAAANALRGCCSHGVSNVIGAVRRTTYPRA